MKNKLTFYKGILINPVSDIRCEFIARGLMVVESGNYGPKIRETLNAEKGEKKYASEITKNNLTDFGKAVLLPGFFDMHFHWVQDDVREMPKDSLLQWLDLYTFPAEEKFADKKYAKEKAAIFFKRLTQTGTLGGACYSSIHEHALDAAMEEARGDFVIGNVLMNLNSPKTLIQTDDDAIALTKRMIKKYGRRHVFTPRFAIATSPKVMKAGSLLSNKAKAFQQSHLSENTGEIDLVLSQYRKIPGFRDVKNYTEIYRKTGMLGRRSLMGHGIHLSSEELALLSRTKTVLVHCPTSNAPHSEKGLESGLFDFKKVERAKVRWALGSDIGGGPFLSMFDVMRSFVEQNARAKVKGATYIKALYRATQAGADILEVGGRTGSLHPQKDVSFFVVPLQEGEEGHSAEETLTNLVNRHRDSRQHYDGMVSRVYLQGKEVHS